MTEPFEALPEPSAESEGLWDSEIHFAAIQAGTDPDTARAEAYKLWLEAERDLQELEGEA